MTTLIFFASLIAGFIVFGFLMNRFVWEPQRRREEEAAPRITLEEVRSFWDAVEADTLPMAKATVQKREPSSPQESRIGGPPLALDADATWPRSASNDFPMAFIAQVNFAEILELEDFPTKGILQIFTSFDMIDETNACEHVIRWDPDPVGQEMMDVPEEILGRGRTWYYSEKARKTGIHIAFEKAMAVGDPANWPYAEEMLSYPNRLPESDEISEKMSAREKRVDRIIAGYGTHWVGGHPRFVQYDVRTEVPATRHLDRVLMHVGADDEVNLGDIGLLNVLISREDLLRRNFDKAYLTWDCY